MAQKEPALIVVYDDRMQAERAVRDLEAAEFSGDQIGMVIRGEDVKRGGMITDAVGAKDGRGAVVGAGTGAVVGGILGAAAALAIPGVGPIVAAGIFTSAFGGAIAGTAIGGILGAMTGLDISEEEAEYYNQRFQQGKAIVAVRPGNRYEDAKRILCARGGYNMHFAAQSPVPTEGTFTRP